MIEPMNRSSTGAFDLKACCWPVIVLLGILLASFATGIAQAQDTTIANVSVEDITETSAVITWTTAEAANSRVNYGNTTSLGATTSDKALVTDHSVTLRTLTPSTVYYYEVVSSNQRGDTMVDNNGGAYYIFYTAPQKTNLGYLIAAYTIIWIAISAYIFSLSRRQKRLWQEIDSLKAKVKEEGDD